LNIYVKNYTQKPNHHRNYANWIFKDLWSLCGFKMSSHIIFYGSWNFWWRYHFWQPCEQFGPIFNNILKISFRWKMPFPKAITSLYARMKPPSWIRWFELKCQYILNDTMKFKSKNICWSFSLRAYTQRNQELTYLKFWVPLSLDLKFVWLETYFEFKKCWIQEE
jgi:hypothetical protein